MNAPQIVLQGKGTATTGHLYMAFELSEKSWKLALGDGARGPSRYTVSVGDKEAVLDRIAKAKARCGLAKDAKVHSCYEAGRDGFWLHRWLIEQGIDNIVVDSSSIEVNRRARRAKTDRLDGDKLLAMLLRYTPASGGYGRSRECPRHSRKTSGAHTGNWSGRGMNAPPTAIESERFWSCTTCEPNTSAGVTGSNGGKAIWSRCRRRCGPRSSAKAHDWR